MTTADELCAIVEADGQHRGWMVEDFLRRREGAFRNIGSRFCRHYKVDKNRWADDFTSIVWEQASALVAECVADPGQVETVQSFLALVAHRATQAADKFVDSSAGFNPASGMTGHKLRYRELIRTKNTLAVESGREPTDEEVVEATNKRMREVRSDPAKQGMICSVDDLHVAANAADIAEHQNMAGTDPVESDAALSAAEMTEVTRLTIAEANTRSKRLGAVAEQWFGPYLDGYGGEPPSTASIGRALGISASTAHNKVREVCRISAAISSQRYGVDGAA